ncbi:sulfatase family protein [Flexithrix dorotheae]|uniref:sulfatase family protein n=1 Tax=Flexithrix dorotheae TaxID=70993 RepID=UPI00037DB552|nr:sulfatase [Flexithrix dorotheae]
MIYYKFPKIILLGLLLIGSFSCQKNTEKNQEVQEAKTNVTRPNIIWIVAEDMSPRVNCFGDKMAVTPNIDQLAAEGMKFTNVYSVSGVCSPSRSALITGCYQTSIGTLHHRTTEAENPYCEPYTGTPPPEVKGFPEYLRKAGYYCTNNAKTDYQFGVPFTIWDETSPNAHYRNRPNKDQPFFAVFNSAQTHESRLFKKTIANLKAKAEEKGKPMPDITDRSKVVLPPYYADHPDVREDVARMYDNIHYMDKWVGELLEELEKEGEAENTIVMFYTDHGTCLPRGKRWMYDSGLKVPLVVKWPEQLKAGSESDQMISFIDFAPTILNLAGIEIPEYIQGQPFLGENIPEPKEYIFAARDRTDEHLDQIRAVRDKKFKYIRNLTPEVPYSYPLSYAEQITMNPTMRKLFKEGKLTGPALAWFAESKPVEELYDTQNDPWEVNNLAENPEYQDIKQKLSARLDEWQKATNDLGLIPEQELRDNIWPGGTQPITQDPSVVLEETENGEVKVALSCETNGASIGYQLGENKKVWTIYDEPFTVGKGENLKVKAIRYGYQESKEVEKVL